MNSGENSRFFNIEFMDNLCSHYMQEEIMKPILCVGTHQIFASFSGGIPDWINSWRACSPEIGKKHILKTISSLR